jgi:hypothetical protein
MATGETVTSFLAALPAERRREIAAVRAVVRRNLPAGYQEAVSHGMIVYQVPLRVYPDTYNGQPLWYAAIGSQGRSCSLHLLNVYGDPALSRRLEDGFRAAGKRLDRGKACVRFRTAGDLALEVIGALVASTSLDRFVALAEEAKRSRAAARSGRAGPSAGGRPRPRRRAAPG